MNRAVLSILVSNHFGVLTRVTNLFSQRGFNIDSLAVGETENENYSRITITTSGDAASVNQMEAFEKCVEDFNGRTQIIEDGCCIVELTDTPASVNYFLEELREYHIKEISRTGGAALQLSTETVY